MGWWGGRTRGLTDWLVPCSDRACCGLWWRLPLLSCDLDTDQETSETADQQTSSQVCRVHWPLVAQSFTELTHELTGAISVKSVAATIVKQVTSNHTHGYLIFPARWHLTVTIEPHQLSHCAPRKLIILRVQTKLNTHSNSALQSQIVLLFYHSHNELHHHGWLHGYSWSKMWRPSRPRNLNKYYAGMMMMMVMWWSGVSQQTPPVATFEPAVTSFSSKQWVVLELGWAGQQMMMMWCVGGGWVVADPGPSHALYIYY